MMKMTKSVLLAMLAASAQTSMASAEPEPVTRIVGGGQADPGEYPYFVDMFGCGGALIAPDAVLFAAHCGDVESYTVHVGAYKKWSLEGGAQERFCDEWIPDPLYGSGGSDFNYDFALCKLNEPVTIDSPITLELNEEDAVPAEGQNLDVMGLGALSQFGSSPEYLHEVTVPAITNSECNRRKYYDGRITDSMLCAGFPEKGEKDACQGDSGGPIVQKIGNKHVHVGVVSWGEGCALATKPGVYSRTSKRASWIKSTVCDQFKSTASFCDNGPPPSPTAPPIPSPTPPPVLSPTPPPTDDDECIDDASFLVKGKEGRTCNWVGKKQRRINKWCPRSAVQNACPKTCEACQTTEPPTPSPTLSPTASPTPSPTGSPTPSPTNSNSDVNSESGTMWDSEIDDDWVTDPPTFYPTFSPTESSSLGFCDDDPNFRHLDNEKRTCTWVGRGSQAQIRKKCRKWWLGLRVFDWCPETCGSRVGLGSCV